MAYEENWIESSKIAAESVSKIWAFLQRYERCLLHRLNGNEQGLKLESFDWHELRTHHQDSLEQYTKEISNCANAVAPEVRSWSSKISTRLNEERYTEKQSLHPEDGCYKGYQTIHFITDFQFFGGVIKIFFLSPSLCTQLAASGISLHTAGSIWWIGSVEEKLNLDYYELIF